MSSSRVAAVGYAFAAVLQAALLGAAWYVQELTTEKMMVMRYFFAKNLLVEAHVFSPVGKAVQVVLFGLAACAAAYGAFRWLSRERLTAMRFAVAAALSTAGAGMLLLMSAEETRGLYVLVFAVWLALGVQLGVVVASARSAARS